MAKQDRPRQRIPQRRGSKVPLVYYRSQGKELEPESPFNKKMPAAPGKIRRFFGLLFNSVVILALLAFFVYSVIVTPNAKIISTSETYHSISDYKNAAQKYLGSLSNRNKITLNEQGIVESLQKQFPEIAGAYIELPILAQTPIIHLNIAQPSFILNSNNTSRIVDSQGTAVAKASQASIGGTDKLTVVTDSSGYQAKDGQQVMSASSVQFIDNLIAQLHHANVPIKSVTLPPLAQELDLRTSDKPYYVKFYLGGDILQQTGQFLASRHQFDAGNTQPAEYLDVRVPGRIFYK